MKLAIAAGGTGGHLFPGISVAEVLREKDPGGEVFFIGSDRGLDKEILEREGLPHEALPVGRIKGEGIAARMRTLLDLPKAFWGACRLLRQKMPNMVFGIGGYSSGPVILAAFFQGRPRAILEPNAIPGFTNRALARFVDRIFIAFPETGRFFPRKKIRLTGTPVRRGLTRVGRNRQAALTKTTFTLLVLGGSQGATSLNRAMARCLPALEASGRSFRIFHQTGTRDLDSVREAYKKTRLTHEVNAFIEDMVSAYTEADLAIARAGASTLAELIETGTPSLLVPYPYAADDHQRMNAIELVEEGGAEMILDKDVEGLLERKILHYEGHREELATMRKNLASLRRVPAAELIAKECLELARD